MSSDIEYRVVCEADDYDCCLAIRRAVFVEEQRCPEAEEYDGLDAEAQHCLGLFRGVAAATSRWRYIDTGIVKFERLAVLKKWRGLGLGRGMLEYALAAISASGCRRVVIHAQSRLCGFYREFGFVAQGEEFVEAGIKHYYMQLDIRE